MLYCTAAFAQSRSSLEISAGASIPVGKFGDKNVQSDKSGLATTGQTVNISYRHLLSKNAGFVVSLIGQRHPLDIPSLETDLSELPASGYFFATGLSSNPPGGVIIIRHYTWQGKKDAWLSGSLLAGPYAQLPLARRLFLSAQAQAGATYIQSPEIQLTSKTASTSARLEQTDPHAIGLAYALQSGLVYKLTDKAALVLNLQYFATSRARFSDVKTTMTEASGTPGDLNYQVSQAQYTGEGRQAINAVNIAAGFQLAL